MQHVELFRGVTSGVEQDGFLASWVIRKELQKYVNNNEKGCKLETYTCDIQDLAIDNNPYIILLVVFANLIHGVLA